jgi:2-haloacid dehalogenase
MQLSDFQALCFDCYGTLIDKESGIYSALRTLRNKGQVTLGRDEILASFAQHESAQMLATPELPYSDILVEAHRRLAKAWGIVPSDNDHLLFGQSVSNWPVFADAPAALQYLERYFKLIVLTSAGRESLASSKRQFSVRFDAVLTAQDIGSYQADCRTFDYLLARLAPLGISKTQILHIAANLPDDHVPASTCGIVSARIDRYRPAVGTVVTSRESNSAACAFHFASMVDMVRAHQEQLVA